MSVFSKIEMGEPIDVIIVDEEYMEDLCENKVCLMYPQYRTEAGETWTLPVVKQAEKNMAEDETLSKSYLSVFGLESFTIAATKLLLGNDSSAILENRTFSLQVLSSTGGMFLIAKFLADVMSYKTVYNSDPTWGLFDLIFKNAGFEELKTYRYWSDEKRGLDMEGLLEDLKNAPEKSVVVLQPSCHNPTGCDPTKQQWKQIADVIEKNKLFPIMDSAYQGLASGDLNEDAWTIRYFISRRMEMVCCQSFSNTFGLYNERIGNVIFVVNDASIIPKIKTKVTKTVLSTYFSPPSHGARVIASILNDRQLFEEWKNCLKTMSDRMKNARHALKDALERYETPGVWNHIVSQKGIFLYLGLSKEQYTYMAQKYHVYALKYLRINVTAIVAHNIDYIAQAICNTVIKFSK